MRAERKQNSEFGLVMILVITLLSYWLEKPELFPFIIGVTLITLLFPVLFTPFTVFWYKISHIIGKIMSSLLLGIIFYLVVTPVGCFRRLIGKDSLSVRQFGKGRKSTFISREQSYTKDDLEQMF